jgi:homogentisate 1,2-dioxygenase
MTPQGKRVLALADGSRTVGELALATSLGEFETTKAAYALIERGYLSL